MNWYTKLLEGVSKPTALRSTCPSNEMKPADLRVVLYGAGDTDITMRGPGGRTYHTTYEGVIPNMERRYHETDSDFVRKEIEKYMAERECPVCHGKRLKPEILAVTIEGKSIVDLTTLSIGEATSFFRNPQARRARAPDRRSDPQRNPRPPHLPARCRPRIPHARPQRQHPGRRRGPAHPAGHPDRLQPHGRALHPRRALDRPAPARQRPPHRHPRAACATSATPSSSSSTTRTPSAPPTTSSTSARRRRARRQHRRRRHARRSRRQPREPHRPVPQRRRHRHAQEAPPGNRKSHHRQKRPRAQPQERRRRDPARHARRHRRLRLRQVQPGQRHPPKKLAQVYHRAGDLPGRTTTSSGSKTSTRSSSRPVAHRPHAALQPRHLHRRLRRHPRAVRPNPRGQDPRLQSRPLQLQRQGRPLRALPGDGIIKIEMHFLPDVYVTCEECKGRRYNREALEIHYKGKNISEVLDMTVEEAVAFFENIPPSAASSLTLNDVGLGYIHLGQPATTFSGGEAQRIKLATELARRSTGRPSTSSTSPPPACTSRTSTACSTCSTPSSTPATRCSVIEHNLDVIKCADWLIDMGPEGGDGGGTRRHTRADCPRAAQPHRQLLVPYLQSRCRQDAPPPV
jgi:hypothetical protein